MDFDVTPVFYRLRTASEEGRFNVLVFEGGSRSSKTYSIIQFFIIWAKAQDKPKRVICSRSIWQMYSRAKTVNEIAPSPSPSSRAF